MQENEKDFASKEPKFEVPTIEVVELVCQNTPDWTHGTKSIATLM